MIEKLREKITSKEGMGSLVYMRAMTVPEPDAKPAQAPWWLQREYLRMREGVYPPPSDVVDNINIELPQFALHVSKEDPTLVAYTPDRASGEADRQVRTTLGKFLAKYYPHLDDNTIRHLGECHLADLDNSFEQLYGDDITKAYEVLGTKGACMSYPAEKYSYGRPTAAYDAPGISMAVLRDKDGVITARCMLYVPSESDKRYIRPYLDAKLTKKLIRAGYKAGTWNGAKFKTIEVPKDADDGRKLYIVPYLDGMGSQGNSSVSMVAVINGELTSVDSLTAARIRNKFGSDTVQQATSTSGALWIKPVDIIFTEKCFLTGVELNWLLDETRTYWDGTDLQTISAKAIIDLNLSQALVTPNTPAYVASGTVMFFSLRSSMLMVDTEANRRHAGFIKLDPLIYPDEQDWVRKSAYLDHTETVRKTWIKSSDAIQIYTSNGWENEHASVIDKTYTRLHPLNGKKAYAAPGAEILRTFNGAKVVDLGYNIQKTYDGVWDFDRNLTHKRILDTTVVMRKGNLLDVSIGSKIWCQVFEKSRVTDDSWMQAVLRTINFYGNPPYYTRVGDARISEVESGYVTLAHLKSSPEIMRSPISAWVIRWAERQLAEAEALDYSLGPTPTPTYEEEHTVLDSVLRVRQVNRTKVEALRLAKREAFKAATPTYTSTSRYNPTLTPTITSVS